MEAFAQLACDLGPLPPHPEHATPGGGSHHFMRQPRDGEPVGNGPGGLPEGIDLRGKGGWVPVPGTVRSDGIMYREREGAPTLADMYAAGTLPEAPAAYLDLIRNGCRSGSSRNGGGGDDGDGGGPVDVDAEFERMRPGRVNIIHCRVIGSLLSKGVFYDEIAERVVDATMAMAAKHYRCRGWTREKEFGFVYDCMADLLKSRCRAYRKDDTAPIWLPEELAELWEAMCADGQRPCITRRKDTGSWYLKDMAWAWNRKGGGAPIDEDVETDPHVKEPKPEETSEEPKANVRWPTPYSARPASAIPRRQWLYGKHYIRGAVTLTAAPGGTGKSNIRSSKPSAWLSAAT
jgi:hypothetical protein